MTFGPVNLALQPLPHMDVFGTVVNTIHLVHKIVGYLQAIRNAEENRLKLLSEISALGAILDVLHHHIGKTSSNGGSISNRLVKAGIWGPLERCYQMLRSATLELERITDIGKSSSFAERMKNVKWPFRQEEIRSMLDKTGRLKSLVSLALQTSLMEFIESAREELAAVGLNVGRIEVAVSALEERQRAHMKEIESRHINLQDLGFSLQNDIAMIRDTVDKMDRNQQDRVIQGDRMRADLTIIKKTVHGQELQDLIKWLSPLDFSEKHNTAFEKRAPGTGEWFLKHSRFLAWARGEFRTLWCPGNPGVGKSVMTSLVIHSLGEVVPEDTALVFVYFDYKARYTMTQLAEAILKQLVRRRVTQLNLESLQKYMVGDRPTSKEILDMLRVEVETYSRVLVVIDALDEADVRVWAPLLRHFQALSNISYLATSRDTGDIALELRPDQRLDIVANEGDMRKYVEGRLLGSTERFRRILEANMGLHEEIIVGVMKKADGMFLLAQLHMNSLETRVGRVTDLRLALAQLPGHLETTYGETLGRINDEDKPLAYRIFSWLIHAARPMTISDLQYALAVDDGMMAIDTQDLYDEATLTSICVGLVVLREDTASPGSKGVGNPQTSSKVVGLVHYTAQEYFLHNRNISSQLADSPHFAITCLRFLAFDIFNTDRSLEDAQKRLAETPFAEYSVFSWGIHARVHCGDVIVRLLAMELLHDSRRVIALGSLLFQTEDLSAIHLCAYFGLRDYLEYLLDNGFDVKSKDSEGDTAVTYAAMDGQEGTLQLLLAREGVDVAPKGWNGTIPLTRATMHGRQGIVALLLAYGGADINWQDNRGRTAIAYAAEHGYGGIAELLLVRDAVDINLQDKDGYTPLALAVTGGHEEIVRLLLARNDANVNSRNNVGNTSIVYAAWKGHSGIVKLLLERGGIEINLRGQYGYTPLAMATRDGCEEIVQLLLARDDVNVNSCSDVGHTPIIYAAWKGHSDIVKLLLARVGVDINSRGQYGHTPLAVAILGGHKEIVQLLLARRDVNINTYSDVGNTPIILASRAGRSDILELLLEQDDVDINWEGQHGNTPLASAILGGHEAIVRLLLTREDLNVNSRNDIGNTPVILATWKGHNHIVKLLLERDDVDINLQDRDGHTPLAHAIFGGHEETMRLLLERDDLDTNLKDNSGNTYLTIAAICGNEGAAKWFLAEANININSKSTQSQVALGQAAREGYGAVVELLLAQEGIDVDPVDSCGHTPLDWAEIGRHWDVIKLLREAGSHTAAELGMGFPRGVAKDEDEG